MIRTLRLLLCSLLLCTVAVAFAQATHSQSPAPARKPAATHATPSRQDPGERAFQNHCSRCHYAPEDLNPRFTGTVVRHMRVRANLSAEDERLIMRFFLP